MQDAQIHWFSIVNSVLIILFLSGMVAMILVRVLHRDFARCVAVAVAPFFFVFFFFFFFFFFAGLRFCPKLIKNVAVILRYFFHFLCEC
jgi:hypothetical protein